MIALILRLLLFACFVMPSTAAAATVNVAVPSFSISLIAFMAAKERGYYREQGLDVNFVLMPAAIASRALIAGNVDFATVGGSALTASLGGAPLRMLFSSFNRSLFWLYSKPDIAEVKDLRGKKVGVSSIGSGPDSMLRDLLRTHGLQGGKDVAIMAVGVDSSRYASLANNVTDAVILSAPYNFAAQDAGFKELVSFVKQAQTAGSGLSIDYWASSLASLCSVRLSRCSWYQWYKRLIIDGSRCSRRPNSFVVISLHSRAR